MGPTSTNAGFGAAVNYAQTQRAFGATPVAPVPLTSTTWGTPSIVMLVPRASDGALFAKAGHGGEPGRLLFLG